jgi:hypothetical protein
MEGVLKRAISRRTALKLGAAGALASQATLLEQLATMPNRLAMAAGALPDIQFAIGNFIPPAFTVNGVLVRFGPIFTTFTPVRLSRTPSRSDQAALANALNTIEAVYPFSPQGVFTFLGYGVPYFNRLPGGMNGALVSRFMPRLLSDPNRFALEEAVPSPTDVLPGTTDPDRTKKTFNVPVTIEHNDLLLTLRSDSLRTLVDILGWLQGSNVLNGRLVPSPDLDGLLRLQRSRVMFQQIGLPRKVADAAGLSFRTRVNPQSPMWMGFFDQQVDAAGPAEIVTFAGNAQAHFTNKVAGNYFDNGSIQHLSHDIQDLEQFYALPSAEDPAGETFKERVQYAFRSNQKGTPDGLPSDGNADQFTDGGGPSALANVFQGNDDAVAAAQGIGTFEGAKRIGHIAALQRHGRLADGTPLHIRMDGTGFDNLDVPNGSNQPKLQFMAFVPTAEVFRAMREGQAALDLQHKFGVDADDNGFERFISATRRQNFLVPPRRHRAFPLVEFT